MCEYVVGSFSLFLFLFFHFSLSLSLSLSLFFFMYFFFLIVVGVEEGAELGGIWAKLDVARARFNSLRGRG